ncbi:hypothetical protein L9F63_000361, partial [Diploptera punctata]
LSLTAFSVLSQYAPFFVDPDEFRICVVGSRVHNCMREVKRWLLCRKFMELILIQGYRLNNVRSICRLINRPELLIQNHSRLRAPEQFYYHAKIENDLQLACAILTNMIIPRQFTCGIDMSKMKVHKFIQRKICIFCLEFKLKSSLLCVYKCLSFITFLFSDGLGFVSLDFSLNPLSQVLSLVDDSSPCDTAQQTLSSGDSSVRREDYLRLLSSISTPSINSLKSPLRVRLLSRCRLPTAEHQGRPSSASVAAGVGLRTTVCFPLVRLRLVRTFGCLTARWFSNPDALPPCNIWESTPGILRKCAKSSLEKLIFIRYTKTENNNRWKGYMEIKEGT